MTSKKIQKTEDVAPQAEALKDDDLDQVRGGANIKMSDTKDGQSIGGQEGEPIKDDAINKVSGLDLGSARVK